MKQTIKKMKSELKEMAQEIRSLKSQRKGSPYGYVPGLQSARSRFRIKHIAYCLLRGRTPEQIENKHRDPSNYEHKYVWQQAEEIVDKIKGESDEAVCASA